MMYRNWRLCWMQSWSTAPIHLEGGASICARTLAMPERKQCKPLQTVATLRM